ncbi:thioesterase family protein [Porticoccaceae bacterium LTM1]|nr:thioesterase family protein [Porticoccaceae bacterium LTM1]
MDTTIITPRFSETDILGHISNTTLPVWFETGRDGFFRRVHPAMTTHDWPLILARIELDLKAQIHLGNDVIIRTGLEKIGNSSVVVYQEAWQNDILAACAKTVMVYFDYQEQCSKPLPSEVRERLAEMLIEPN